MPVHDIEFTARSNGHLFIPMHTTIRKYITPSTKHQAGMAYVGNLSKGLLMI